MSLLRFLRIPLAMLIAAMTVSLGPGRVAALAACTRGWQVVDSPSPGPTGSQLLDVATVGPSDVWAAGVAGGSPSRTLIEHWNGSTWRIVPSVDPGALNTLSGVAAFSSDDVWAVGSTFIYGSEKPLIEHWNGTEWSVVPADPKVPDGALVDVAGSAPDNIWAVGLTGTAGLAEHWDGTSWTQVPIPNTAYTLTLWSVWTSGPNDVWAVGEQSRESSERRIAIHWNGGAWAFGRSDFGGNATMLLGVWGSDANDVWAVGNARSRLHVEHWDGSRWATASAPHKVAAGLSAVNGSSGSDVWTVGSWDDYPNGYKTVTEHWDGRSWKLWPSPNPDQNNLLVGVAVEPTSDAWAVGIHYSEIQQTLVERFSACGR